MENQNSEIVSGSTPGKKSNFFPVILCTAIVVIILYFVFQWLGQRNSSEYKKQLEELKKEMAVLKQKFAADSLRKDSIVSDITVLKADRKDIKTDIAGVRAQLLQYPKKYEKIPDYNTIGDDSVLQLFTDRFDY
jgi:hypothetical protein